MTVNLELIINRISKLPYDLRAEAILSCFFAVDESINEKLIVCRDGQFKRSYRKDILDSEIIDYEYDSNQFLKVSISRDGIYDLLPEVFFHYPKSDAPKRSVQEMTHEYQRQKQEEENARQFFSPFESEFFYHALKIENDEKNFLLDLNGSKPFDFLYDFWGIDKNLPPLLTAKFIRILPYMHKMVGDLELTKKCLQYLLGEKVEIEQKGYQEQSDSQQNSILGEGRLGHDLIAGSNYMDYSLHLKFNIGPLKDGVFEDYVHEGGKKKFLNLFFEHFLPMEIDYEINILLSEHTEAFDFSQKAPVLGLTTRI